MLPIRPVRSLLAALIVLSSCVAMPRFLHAAVPETMSYQGLLSDDLGAPLADGPHSLVFTIYTDAVAGVAVWTETQPAVVLTGGLFAVTLGSVTPLSIAFDQQLWLGVAVDGGADLDPRSPLAASPYALAVRLPLPANAVDASSILDEPGIAQSHANSSVVLGGAGNATYANLLSVTITTPADGYLLVSASTSLVVSCATLVSVQITEASNAALDNGHVVYAGGLSGGIAPGYIPMSTHRTYFKPAGTYTFYLGGRNSNFTACLPVASNPTLTAVFLPTSYGSVVTSATSIAGEADAGVVDLRELELRATRLRVESERAQHALEVAALRNQLKAGKRATVPGQK